MGFHVRFKKAGEVFQTHPDLTSVPVMVYIPPGRRLKKIQKAGSSSYAPFPVNAKANQQLFMRPAQHTLEWVHTKILEAGERRDHVFVYKSPWPKRRNYMIGISMALGGWYAMVKLLGHRIVNCLVAWGVIAYVLSGTFWNNHRHAQWSGDRGEWFQPWSGSQY